jgi:hypothetical protein
MNHCPDYTGNWVLYEADTLVLTVEPHFDHAVPEIFLAGLGDASLLASAWFASCSPGLSNDTTAYPFSESPQGIAAKYMEGPRVGG